MEGLHGIPHNNQQLLAMIMILKLRPPSRQPVPTGFHFFDIPSLMFFIQSRVTQHAYHPVRIVNQQSLILILLDEASRLVRDLGRFYHGMVSH